MATYQVFAAPITDNLAHFQAWAQFFGGGFTTLGWSAQTGHGEQAATGTGGSYAWTTPALPSVALAAMSAYTYRGSWVSGTAYANGSNTANGTADLVKDDSVGGNGVTYQKITTNTATNLTTAPHSNATDWQPYTYEIWKSSGSNTTALPIFVRLAYGLGSGANGTRIMVSVGTGVDANGNLSGTVNLTSTAPVYAVLCDTGLAGSSSTKEMDLSGDADNVRWIVWRGVTGSSAGGNNTLVIDRAKSASGTDTNAYFYIGSISNISSGTFKNYSSVVLNSTFGGATMQSTAGWCGVVFNGGLTTSTALMGAVPPYPIFPIVGFLGNPCLGVVGFGTADVQDGTVYPVWMYGSSHNYLANSVNGATPSATLLNVASTIVPAIRWE